MKTFTFAFFGDNIGDIVVLKILKLMVIERKREVYQQLTDNILQFWQTKAIDSDFGGFVGFMNAEGVTAPRADKSAIAHGRILWSFSAAYQQLGDEHLGYHARRAYQCLLHRFCDKEHFGVYDSVSFDGKVNGDKKSIVAQAYAIYGLCGYYQATKDNEALEQALRIFNQIQAHGFDVQAGGYVEFVSGAWQQVSNMQVSDDKEKPVSLRTQVHLHLLEAYTALLSCQDDSKVQLALAHLLQLIIGRFIDKKRYFVHQSSDQNSDGPLLYGHDLELSYLMVKAAKALQSKQLIEVCQNLALKMINRVINHHAVADNITTGGIGLGKNLGEAADVQREGWVQAEAISAFCWAYEYTGDEKYLQWIEGTWFYIEQFIVDKTLGDWHSGRHQDGRLVSHQAKIGPWKCPYHAVRCCLVYYQMLTKDRLSYLPLSKAS